MLDQLDQLQTAGLSSLDGVSSADQLEKWRQEYLGNSGKVKAAMGGMKDVPKEAKAAVGARMNAVRAALEEAFKARQEALGPAASAVPAGPMIDMTEPGLLHSTALGRKHIITRVRDELVEVFARMGFGVAQGPELEDDEHNFIKLNIPAQHPARDPGDNYYIDDPLRTKVPRMLRSQTSTVQIRVMEAATKDRANPKLPIKIVSPGRVYRPDEVDATHSFMFHQIEGLYIDRGVSMADLKTCLLQFAKAYFGPEANVRLRPSYFPFTEPSAEVDLYVRLRADQPWRWIEMGGCGMVDPAVLEMCGIDPEEWSGFAFGFGIERLAMGKYAIPDIRMLFENDLRFLRQL